MRSHAQTGISLVEVMVVVFIVGLLIAAGIPSFTAWIQNTQIRTASEGIINGLQTAKNAAIQTNTCMQFTLQGKTGWIVNPCADCLAAPPFAQRAAEEGSINADIITKLPADSSSVAFSGLGRVVAPSPCDGSDPLTQMVIGNPTMTGSQATEERRLQINIPAGGGSVRMCDPAPTVAIGDPRRCT